MAVKRFTQPTWASQHQMFSFSMSDKFTSEIFSVENDQNQCNFTKSNFLSIDCFQCSYVNVFIQRRSKNAHDTNVNFLLFEQENEMHM